MFPIKAVFWTLVVAAFVPAGFHAAPNGVFAQETYRIAGDLNAGSTNREVASMTQDFCAERAETCQVVEEFGQVAGFVANLAADRAEDVLNSPAAQETVLTAEQLFAEAAGET